MKVDLSRLLAAAGAVLGGGVALYEMQWLGRSGLALPIMALGLGVLFSALAALTAGRKGQ